MKDAKTKPPATINANLFEDHKTLSHQFAKFVHRYS